MRPCLNIIGVHPDLITLLKRIDKGFERKLLKVLIRGNRISKGQTLVFLSFSILLSVSDGETERKEHLLVTDKIMLEGSG